MELRTFTFAVYPADFDDSFEAFLIDVPTMDVDNAQDRAARRAYFSAMAGLAPRGFDIEDFAVCAWVDNKPGALVTMKGLAA